VVSHSALCSGEYGRDLVRDLVIDDPRPREGDWVMVPGESGSAGVRAFGRINGTAHRNRGRCAFSSVFWRFDGDVPAPSTSAFPPLPNGRDGADPLSTCRVISWFAERYRIGFQHLPAADSGR